MMSIIDINAFVELLHQSNQFGKKNVIIVDCRPFTDYNKLHIRNAVNAFYSKMMRRRLYDNKVCSSVMLSHIGDERKCKSKTLDLVLYSDNDDHNEMINNCSVKSIEQKRSVKFDDSSSKLLNTLQEKLDSSKRFNRVLILQEGFREFRRHYPALCESSRDCNELERNTGEFPFVHASLSNPCLSINEGPTKIFSFLYLGSQQDALDSSLLQRYGIKYVINLSVNCPQPEDTDQELHFMRIPVNDSYQEKLLPYFKDAFNFLDEVDKRQSVALVHCLAGISRSPTLAIAYVMKRNKWTSEQAYKFVKEKRPSISPNFNFMGQLLEFESQLRADNHLKSPDDINDIAAVSSMFEYPSASKILKEDRYVVKNSECGSISKMVNNDVSSSINSDFRPQRIWDNDHREPSSKTNENGKRALEPKSAQILDRPRVLDGLKSRRALSVPQVINEDLPSPSSELQKLSFSAQSPDEISATNPFFSRPDSLLSTDPSEPSTSYSLFSAANPTFDKAQSAAVFRDGQKNTKCLKTRSIFSRMRHFKHYWRRPPLLVSGNTQFTTNERVETLQISNTTSKLSLSRPIKCIPEVVRSQSDNALNANDVNIAISSTPKCFIKNHKSIKSESEKMANSSIAEGYHENDRDSMSSTSSLEIIVQ